MRKVPAVFCVTLFAAVPCGFAQPTNASSGTVRGSVVDPSGGAIVGAAVSIGNPVSGYMRSTVTDSQGKFEFGNLPFNSYHLNTTAPNFEPAAEDVDVRSPIPVERKVTLQIATAATTVVVTSAAQNLIEPGPVTRTAIDRQLFEKLPLESQSSSLSSVVTLSTPGVTADSNGLFHGLGDHASNSFSLDGQPITDQQSKVFSNQIPLGSVQSMSVIEGAPPAEYGDKTSLVIVVTTRSGLGVDKPHGDVTASYGTFGTTTGGFDLAYGDNSLGNFFSASGLDTGRFLDAPEFGVMHARGNEADFFDRVDFKPTQNDTITLNLNYTRSWFQTPNSFDAQDASAWSGVVVNNGGLGPNGLLVGPQDQRSKIETVNVAPAWTRSLGAHALFTLGAYVRRDVVNYYPSRNPYSDLTGNLQSETVGQHRTLTNSGGHGDIAYVNGIHDIKTGIQYMQTFLTEEDSFGIVNPLLNPVCLYANGDPFTGPSITDPLQCTGLLQPNPGFVPLLGCIDLTRLANLPASDGCPTSVATPYRFHGHADVKELALYFQDNLTFHNWVFNLGLRGDIYNGLASAKLIEPRLGAAYNLKRTNTVLRASYARTLETPFNENLVLSSRGCDDAIVNALMSTLGPCNDAPLAPGWRNEYHLGLQQAFGKYLVVDGEYIWKYTHRAYDFSVFGNTPLTFPIEWARSKIPGYAVRTNMPTFHGLTAFVVFSSVAARFFTPQVAGIGATPGGSSVFRIDHDELFNQTTNLQYQPWKNGPWLSFTWRYDSGLVAGPVPCAGGNCANGPLGSDTVVDFSMLTPDQQYQAGLFCGAARATPTTPINSSGLCAASQYGSTLISIPAPGTENDDHNPPRIASRHLFDIGVGHDDIFHNARYKWSFRLAVVNLTSSKALYNFLSTFSGTHYVSPRTLTATIGFHF
jgi:hypothetical protein